MRVPVAALVISICVAPLQLSAQNISSNAASARATQLVTMFSKNKHVVKEKHGVRQDKFKDVRSTAAVTSSPSAYSGDYDAGLGFVLHLKVQPDGQVQGNGEEPLGNDARAALPFVLENAKVDGVLLTGTMVYRDGSREKLEGVFIERTSRESESDSGTTSFGIGVIVKPRQASGLYIERLFYERASS